MKDKISLLKQIELELKIGVVLTDIIMTLYVLWLICTNNSTWIIGVLFGFTPFGAFEIFRASRLFHLCTTYKLMLIHIVMVYCCCVYQAKFGFGDILPTMRIIMFVIGFILLLNIIFKCCKYNECCCKENDN